MVDRKTRIKLWLFTAFVVIIAILVVSIFCESLGVFPGSLLNGFSVQKYLKDSYPDLDYSITNTYYDKKIDKYVYECEFEEGTFRITAKGLGVYEDGYFDNYLRDNDLIKELSLYIENLLKDEIPLKSAEYIHDIEKGVYQSAEDALDGTKGKYVVLLEVAGQSLGFDKYKELSAEYSKKAYETELDFSRLRIFYFREPKEGETEAVLQYESNIDKALLYHDAEVVEKAANTHFIVELDPKLERDYKIYTFFQRFYLIFLLGTVLILSVVWIVRKYRKLKAGKTIGG